MAPSQFFICLALLQSNPMTNKFLYNWKPYSYWTSPFNNSEHTSIFKDETHIKVCISRTCIWKFQLQKWKTIKNISFHRRHTYIFNKYLLISSQNNICHTYARRGEYYFYINTSHRITHISRHTTQNSWVLRVVEWVWFWRANR